MIRITKMNGKPAWLNADWIQSIENTPDTLITLTTGQKMIVRDTADEIAEAFKTYKRSISGERDLRKDTEQ